jgi:cytidine deaminase
MDDRDLIQRAQGAKRNAYAPYSGFKVGAALLGKSGRVYLGCNVENASYGLTICAERNAVAQAVARGERAFVKLALVIEGEEPALPCGACLQVLSEFGKDLEILSSNEEGKLVRTRLSRLLPRAFRRDSKKGRTDTR